MAEIAPAWIKKLGFAELGVSCPPPAPFEEAAAVKKSGPGEVRRLLNHYFRMVRSLRDGGAGPSRALPGIFCGSESYAERTLRCFEYCQRPVFLVKLKYMEKRSEYATFIAELRAGIKRRQQLKKQAFARRKEQAREKARQAADLIRSRGGRRVFLFGSLARGKSFWEHSDIDLAVSGLPREVNFWQLYADVLARWSLFRPIS